MNEDGLLLQNNVIIYCRYNLERKIALPPPRYFTQVSEKKQENPFLQATSKRQISPEPFDSWQNSQCLTEGGGPGLQDSEGIEEIGVSKENGVYSENLKADSRVCPETLMEHHTNKLEAPK